MHILVIRIIFDLQTRDRMIDSSVCVSHTYSLCDGPVSRRDFREMRGGDVLGVEMLRLVLY